MPLGAIGVSSNRIILAAAQFSIGSWCLHVAARPISVTAKSRRFNAMKKTSIGLELTEEEILFFRMPDEALEIVAGAAKQNDELQYRILQRALGLRWMTSVQQRLVQEKRRVGGSLS
jgi:hypothetical protein